MAITCSSCNLFYPLQCEEHEKQTNNDLESERNLFKCPECKKTFQKHAWFRKHVDEQLCMASYECFLCSKLFSQLRHLKNHLQVHTHETKYSCDECNKPFYRQDKLLEHQKVHSEDSICSICSESFITKADLRRHYKSHPSTSFTCNICAKRYWRQHSLRTHMLTHTNGLTFICKYCKQKFWASNHLKNHQIKHYIVGNDSSCLCLVCGEHCGVNDLAAHMGEVHEGRHDFSCKVCQKSFKRKSNLTIHEKCHNHKFGTN